ncbi:AcfA family outer membrane beta-barrel protein [Photobacterium aphoticum]|uniref:Organic solvent ABC transporter substrate-binding protein n=1 Tax=Photobacterium aphoticum TaxID=754436 RepID=A0A0J1GTD8_9GAMM|nr:AcfA family outer membrane beta-barrel protein [Photobacterium aphoticum]KLV03010.1 organic solvent ABC transporter substrate-binding protein [Photobacterium aphoticum]PSU57872.1 porin family protein [Photobacterium aphoticum]GHA60462.1 accessory colonization factor AcfA [Photobacterium aphoticum]
MKKTLSTLLIACSFSATAAPYVGLEYGVGSASHDATNTFSKEGVHLDPSLEDGILGGFVGYAFNDNWALELGYNQFELSDSHSSYLGLTADKAYHHEMDWDASVDAKQVTLAPVYTFAFNDQWRAKVKAGLTYTQYDASQSKTEEWESVTNDDIEHEINHPTAAAQSQNEIGGMVSVGAEYAVLPQLTVGANVKYQADSYASMASFNIGTTYYF